MPDLTLDPRTTALVLIDLQHGIVAGDTHPHASRDVVQRAVSLAHRFRELGAVVARRGVRTIVLGGMSTNVGVEATARAAHERGFEQVFVADAMAARAADLHDFPVTRTFPTLGRVRTTAQVLAALADDAGVADPSPG